MSCKFNTSTSKSHYSMVDGNGQERAMPFNEENGLDLQGMDFIFTYFN